MKRSPTISLHNIKKLVCQCKHPDEIIIRMTDFHKLRNRFKPASVNTCDEKGPFIQIWDTKFRPSAVVSVNFTSLDISHAPLEDQVE